MKRAQLKRLTARREARRTRTQDAVKVNVDRPRLLIHRSNKHLYAQVIHPTNASVLASASTVEKSIGEALKSKSNKEAAAAVGAAIGKRALEKGVNAVVFDRKHYRYHGRVKAMADAAREAGLSF